MHALTIAFCALVASASAKSKTYSVQVTPYLNNAANTCSGTAYKAVVATTKNGCQVSTAPTNVNSSIFAVKPIGKVPGDDRCLLRFGGDTTCDYSDSDVYLTGKAQCISDIGYDYQSFQLVCGRGGG